MTVAAVVRIVPLVAIMSAPVILPIMAVPVRVVNVGPRINYGRPAVNNHRWSAIRRRRTDHRRWRQAHFGCPHDYVRCRKPDDDVRQRR